MVQCILANTTQLFWSPIKLFISLLKDPSHVTFISLLKDPSRVTLYLWRQLICQVGRPEIVIIDCRRLYHSKSFST